MSTAPQKIILRNTTKMSLNDRFTKIKNAIPVSPPKILNTKTTSTFGNAREVHQQLLKAQEVTRKNKRLALQMENRPSVIAALKLKKQSMKNRLGLQLKNQYLKKQILTNKFLNQGLLKFSQGRYTSFRGRGFSRGRLMRGRGSFNNKRVGMISKAFTNTVGNKRGQKGFNRGRGRGLRGGIGRGGKNVTKDDLDKELDSYMCNTKKALDDELDSYMSQADK